jgi:hypothetical protein
MEQKPIDNKLKPKIITQTTIRFIISIIIGQMLGVLFGFLFDLLYIKILKLYTPPVGSVITVGFAIGYLFGWLGGLISHLLLGDYGAVGGISIGIIGATIPVISVMFEKAGEIV